MSLLPETPFRPPGYLPRRGLDWRDMTGFTFTPNLSPSSTATASCFLEQSPPLQPLPRAHPTPSAAGLTLECEAVPASWTDNFSLFRPLAFEALLATTSGELNKYGTPLGAMPIWEATRQPFRSSLKQNGLKSVPAFFLFPVAAAFVRIPSSNNQG